jgi:CRP/FNR family transcriptional regulator, cyclic AMP receptor protein
MEWRLLADVPPEDARLLLSVARRRRFERGEIVFHEHDPGDSLHLIASGHFAIATTTPLGDRVWLGVRGPGDSFGELAVTGAAVRRSATVTALEPSETFAVYTAEFERLRAQHPEVDEVLISILVRIVEDLTARLLEALYLPAEQRLLRRLCELAEVYDDVIPLTQEELAECVGATRATVNQLLRDEQERGTIELARSRTRIRDLDELRRRIR